MTSLSRKEKILKAANALFEEQKRLGMIAVVSPSPQDLIDDIIASVNLTKPNNIIIDVGCGDGRWLLSWIARRSGDYGIGIDIDESRLKLARENCCSMPGTIGQRVEIALCDYSFFDFKVADVVVVYLSRFGNDIVKDKILRECKRGTIVIAVGFSMYGWEATQVFKSAHAGICAYVYTVPEIRSETSINI